MAVKVLYRLCEVGEDKAPRPIILRASVYALDNVMAATPCQISWYPLVMGESLCGFGYHRHPPDGELGLIPDELITEHPSCIVDPGYVLQYDPVGRVIYSTPVGASALATRKVAAFQPAAGAASSPSAAAAAAAAPDAAGWISL